MALLLSKTEVQSLVSMGLAMEAVEEAFRQLALGNVNMPQRPIIKVPEHQGTVLFMPAHIAGMDALGVKVVSVYPENPAKHRLPTVMGVILLTDVATGRTLAIMDGGHITAMRTGAVSGVATRHMARSDARIAGVFGAGVQARAQLLALAEARPLAQAFVFDVIPDQAIRFSEDMRQRLGIPVEVAASARQLVEEADILALATSAAAPVFDGHWVKPGTHINGIGSHAPHMRELDTEIVRRSRVIVDLRQAALSEAGDLMIPLQEGAIDADHIQGELGEVVTGRVAGRTSASEITLFKSEGLAIQDVALAARVYDLAVQRGVGQEVDL